jgi:hypothetical protein
MPSTVVTLTDLNHSLIEIRQAATDLYRFTEKLTLLKIVQHVAVQTIKVVDSIQKEVKTASNEKQLSIFQSSKLALFLEDVVDADIMSELENYILPFAKNLENSELTTFLSEVTDKTEAKYNVMLQKIHEFNALIKNEFE